MAVIPPRYFDCVVAIGVPRNQEVEWRGSGFLLGCPDGGINPKDNEPTYQIWLVSNRHVLRDLKEVVLGFNPQKGIRGINLLCPLIDKSRNIVHFYSETDSDISRAVVDVAVAPIRWELLAKEGVKFSCFRADQDAADYEKLKRIQLMEGDSVFVMGYPLGLTTADNDLKGTHYPLIRAGVIARIGDYLASKSRKFLIDTANFPGNSGGPVIVRPEILSVESLPAQTEPLLIGLVSAYQVHANQLTKLTSDGRRIPIYLSNDGVLTEDSSIGSTLFTAENSGLAIVEPIQSAIILTESYPHKEIGKP